METNDAALIKADSAALHAEQRATSCVEATSFLPSSVIFG